MIASFGVMLAVYVAICPTLDKCIFMHVACMIEKYRII